MASTSVSRSRRRIIDISTKEKKEECISIEKSEDNGINISIEEQKE
jgi:hypothetical protein